ncbi:YeeE/YedE family protein [Vibrio lentus]|uniref:YeeE/YedE family protein n=1 Tax=Vibrio lentus TaxID=136468 RepID=UPI000C829616|nr:hypothetical protein [Vibrio lentus]PMI84791.1 hypothetical protein BCU36_04540 [Vibrio lentus]
MSLIPWDALFGGMLLGASAIILMLGTGRVAGISGIVSRLLPLGSDNNASKASQVGSDNNVEKTEKHWRIAFVVGMARLSKRSIVATCVFMGVAIVTVFIKNLIGLGA